MMNFQVSSISASPEHTKFWEEAEKGTCTICGEPLNNGKKLERKRLVPGEHTWLVEDYSFSHRACTLERRYRAITHYRKDFPPEVRFFETLEEANNNANKEARWENTKDTMVYDQEDDDYLVDKVVGDFAYLDN